MHDYISNLLFLLSSIHIFINWTFKQMILCSFILFIENNELHQLDTKKNIYPLDWSLVVKYKIERNCLKGKGKGRPYLIDKRPCKIQEYTHTCRNFLLNFCAEREILDFVIQDMNVARKWDERGERKIGKFKKGAPLSFGWGFYTNRRLSFFLSHSLFLSLQEIKLAKEDWAMHIQRLPS